MNVECARCQDVFQVERWDYNKRMKIRGRLFCSKGCASTVSNVNRYEKRLLKCANCGKEEMVNETDRRQFYCGHPCYHEHQKDRFIEHARQMNKLYNHKAAATLKANLASGKTVHPWLGKKHSDVSKAAMSRWRSNYFKTNKHAMLGKKHTPEVCQKMSEARSRLIMKGGFLWKGVHFFSEKNNRQIFCRSSWEEKYFRDLETRSDVASYDSEPVAIPYMFEGSRKLYHPDVVIRYTDGSCELQEIKPQYYVKFPINQAKFAAAEAYCKDLHMPFKVVTEKELGHLIQ